MNPEPVQGFTIFFIALLGIIANGLIVHNSAHRFERIREGAKLDHFKKVADYMKEQFIGNKNLKGIIIGGPGPTKYDFIDTGQITAEVKKVCHGTQL